MIPVSRGFQLLFDSTHTIRITSDEGGFVCSAPVRLTLVSGGRTVTLTRGYDSVVPHENGYLAEARAVSENGSVFLFRDLYTPVGDGVLMSRTVLAEKADGGDEGFSTEFRLEPADRQQSEPEWFIPSLLYRDSGDITPAAAFSPEKFRKGANLLRETRCGLPMVMMRDPDSGLAVSLAHIAEGLSDADDITPAEALGAFRVDGRCRYGYLGIEKGTEDGSAICWGYPYRECPRVYGARYDGSEQESMCYHPAEEGFRQEYRLYITAVRTADYNEAMTELFLRNYSRQPMQIAEADTERIYNVSVDDLSELYVETTLGRGTPFAVFVDNGQHHSISFQIGFIGMQTTLAHHMLRRGIREGNEDLVKKGTAILDFWSSLAGTESGVVKAWFDDTTFRCYPPFLRIMSDGMEGMLDAVLAVRASGRKDIDTDQWLAMALRFADFLAERQNGDGSYYRAYDYHGNAYEHDNPDGLRGDFTVIAGVKYDKTMGTSKLNTAIPVRFLVRIWEFTGDGRYLAAAKRAGDYVYRVLYPTGRYVGGTPDNPNTVDKEAGMYALFAYSALYGATEDPKYLKAAEQAAVFVMSWTYLYRFRVPNPGHLLAAQAAEQGCSDGLSVIATGHSFADTYLSVAYYEFFKLYVRTGDERYRHMALFLEKNTKQTMNLYGRFGYVKESFMAECTSLADFCFRTAETRGVWLPWITAVNIEPICLMERTFGKKSAADLMDTDRAVLAEQLARYGSGGDPGTYM